MEKEVIMISDNFLMILNHPVRYLICCMLADGVKCCFVQWKLT